MVFVKLKLKGNILGTLLKEKCDFGSRSTEEYMKQQSSGKCDLQGKAEEEKPEQELDNSLHIHKKLLQIGK